MLRRLLIALVLTVGAFAAASAQRYYSPDFSLGAKGGATISQMSFSPGVRQSMIQGTTFGIMARYTEEKYFGLIAELNFTQRGWAENFQELPFTYRRTLSYIQLPLLTHVYFGSRKFKGFVNLGPEVGMLFSDHISSNFDYANVASVPGFPLTTRRYEQLDMKVKNRFDYGIAAGLGMEFFINRRNSIMLEGRFYYGLGNIFPASKADVFAASRAMSIEITLGYFFRII